MRILLIHQYFLQKEGSGGSRFNEMVAQWAVKGHKTTVLAGMVYYNSGKKYREYKGKFFFKENYSEKIEIIRCHETSSSQKNFLFRLLNYFSFMFTSLLAGIFKLKGDYDVVIVTSPPLFVGVSGYIISRIKRIPLVFEVRDLWPESAIDTGVLKNKIIIKLAYWFEAFIYRKAALINVLTPAFYNTLKNIKKVPENKLIYIPNAADFALSEDLLQNFDRESFRKEHHLQGRFVLTYVGAHGVANHLEQVLEAGKMLEDTNVLFLLIGEGMEKERLKKMAEAMEMSNVRFIDAVPKKEVFKYILASEMGMSVLKKVDTFKTVYSNKTFDYMSCKRSILMAIDGVSRALVEEAKCGTYVEPENSHAYNKTIRAYLSDPVRLKKEGENGYIFARKSFDRELLATRYINYIRDKALKGE